MLQVTTLVKLHILVSEEIEGFITPVITADINVLENIADDLHNTFVYADKADVSNALKQFLEEQNTVLNTPVKKR